MDTKQQMLKAIEELPDDANVEDALEKDKRIKRHTVSIRLPFAAFSGCCGVA